MIEKRNGNISWLASEGIPVPHGFTNRYGGVSGGIYDSLNLRVHSEDDPANVRENFRRALTAMGMPIDRLVRSQQVHRDDILIADESDIVPLYREIPYNADGLITNVPNLPLMIFTADCLPLLLYDSSGAVGAVHCGWRSTVMNIAGKAVRLMGERYGTRPKNVRAAIGACIGKCCFETGEDVAEGVRAVLGGDGFVEEAGNGKYKVDLKGVVRELLIRSGVKPENIDITDECTVCRHDKYWSHRFTKGQRGLQAAVIMLER